MSKPPPLPKRTSAPPRPPRRSSNPTTGSTSAEDRSEWVTTFSIVMGVVLVLLIMLVILAAVALTKKGDAIAGDGGSGSGIVDSGQLGGSPNGNPLGQDVHSNSPGLEKENVEENGESSGSSDAGEGNGDQSTATEQDATTVTDPDEESALAMTDVILPIYVPAPPTTAGAPSASSAAPFSKDFNPFATGSEGKDVVFVIDKSSSMQGTSLPRVCRALKDAIDALRPDQKFAVIFFDHMYYLCPDGEGLFFANKQNKKMITDWIDSAFAGGATLPEGALLKALEFNPEKIILLSDGEFDPLTVATVTQVNHSRRSPVVIDCIGLVENIITLQQLAQDNQGIYYQAK